MRVSTDRRIRSELAAERAAAEATRAERARIAGDLHDSLAHALTLITLQAGSARERKDHALADEALAAIERTGREALADMQRFLALLGPGSPDAPGIADLPGLVEQVRSGGLEVELDAEPGQVTPGVSTTVFRVVQEALTNVVRHSDARTARVAVHRDGAVLVARVSDDGRAVPERTHGLGPRPRGPDRAGAGLRRDRLLRPHGARVAGRGADPPRGGIDVTGLRVVVADDEPLVRQGMRLVLELEPGLEILGEASDGREAVELVRRHRPDLALLDVRMPGMDGIEAARLICAEPDLRETRVVVLTTFADDALLVGAIRAGASGYLLKSMPPDEIRSSVRAVAEGRAMLAPSLMDRLLHEYAGRRTEPAPELAKLTDRETDVLREIATGRSNGEIAARLYVSEGTVKTHVAAVLRKLDLRDRTQAAVAAYELGLVRPRG